MLIDKFLDCYYNKLQKKELNKAVLIPNSMLIKGSKDEEGWQKWQPSSSALTDNDIKNVEKVYNIKIPQQYIDYIKNRQFMDIEIEEFTLYGINEINTWQKIIHFLPDEILVKGLLPIGVLNNDNYIALNTKDGSVVELSYDKYKIKNIFAKDFNAFIHSLYETLKCPH